MSIGEIVALDGAVKRLSAHVEMLEGRVARLEQEAALRRDQSAEVPHAQEVTARHRPINGTR